MRVAIHWFRADLRLHDNAALHAACREADVVVPIFIFDPLILRAPDTGAPIVGFMLECLRALGKDIQLAGGQFVFRHGPPEREMEELLRQTQANSLYFNRDYEPMARERDAIVTQMARARGVEVRSFKDGVLHEPDEILKDDGTPYKVFTAYSRVWRRKVRPEVLPKARLPRRAGFKFSPGLAMPTAQKLGFKVEIPLPPSGEDAARGQLRKFCANDLSRYASQRDFPALGATSRLSPHLRLGTISPRTVVAAAKQTATRHPATRQHVDTFVGELIWRDFYRQILWHFPHVAAGCFRPQYDALKWENDERLFRAWCEGRTGFPIVDAGMRQLNRTGWMHNRARMITAMFLTKDLLVSWQWGERYFMQKLLDADLASNNGGWQWSAGTGTDAQPWFRIFNPIAQARKFDPEGIYIRDHVPEVDSKKYPAPIVDHAEQRLKRSRCSSAFERRLIWDLIRHANGYPGENEMKNTKLVLIAASMITAIGGFSEIGLAVFTEFNKDILKAERGLPPSFVADLIAQHNTLIYWDLIESGWYFIITALLIVAIRTLKNSK